MFIDEIKEITDLERDAVPVGQNLQEMKVHGDIDFPLILYPVTLSELYFRLIRWHWHPEIELIYVVEGKVDALIDEESFKQLYEEYKAKSLKKNNNLYN